MNVLSFLIGKSMAENAGIRDANEANRVGILAGFTGLTPMGIITTKLIVDKKVADQSPLASPVTAIVAMPQLIGLSLADATKALEGVGLTVGAATDSLGQPVSSGTVAGVPHAPGELVQAGTAIKLLLIPAPTVTPGKYTSVPLTKGLTLAAARQMLDDAGLKPGTVKDTAGADATAGKVLEMSIKPYRQILEGTVVDLTVQP